MAAGPPSERLRRTLHAGTGICLAGFALAGDRLAGSDGSWGSLRQPLLALAMIVLLLGWVRLPPFWARASAGFCVSCSLLVALLLAGEGAGRALQWDWGFAELASRRFPPFYRKPSVRTGEVFFRRRGPEVWQGEVITTILKELDFPASAYAEEPAILVRYDKEGFRNDPGLKDWEFAIAGDSFTELGHLPAESLFTRQVGEALGIGVKNLGVSYTGPFTQLHYLQAYGLAASTRGVAVAFYEGNDLEDLRRESWALETWRTKGRRPAGPLPRQTSLLLALAQLMTGDSGRAEPRPRLEASAILELGGRGTPVSFDSLPPNARDLDVPTAAALEQVMNESAAFARRHRIAFWWVYVPTKRRVWHEWLRFPPEASTTMADWTPSDLPDHIGQMARQRGIGFVDLTPALVAATRERQSLLFNPIAETHLTAEGAAVVAQELARRISLAPTPSPGGVSR